MLRRTLLPLLLLPIGLTAAACGDDEPNRPPPTTLPGDTNNPTHTNLLEAQDQTLSDPSSVTISRVRVSAASWIVIYEDELSVAGPPIGEQLIMAGEQTSVAITLDRPATHGERLYAVLHEDSPADGELTFGTPDGGDQPALAANGEIAIASFTVSLEGGALTPLVQVQDQLLAAPDQVTVARVVSPEAGWLVIYADDADGPSAQPLGQTALEAGTSQDVTVALSRSAASGERLYAALHHEDPVDGQFTYDGQNDEDVPVLDADNARIAPGFTVTLEGASSEEGLLEVADQTLNNRTLTIARVIAPQDSWIVIYEDDDGAPGAVIGHAQALQGERLDARVTLERDPVDGETLYAWLHEDTGASGTFEFDGANGLDLPLRHADDAPIGSSFEIIFSALILPVVEVFTSYTVSTLNQVAVARVVAPEDGWIAIYEADQGAPGALLGQSAVVRGDNLDVVVTLTRELTNDERLIARLHAEDPSDGQFTYDGANNEDLPVLDASGAQLAPEFGVIVPEPNLLATMQLLDLATVVTIGSTTTFAPSFVVVYDNADNALGHTAAPLGNANNVRVVLSRPVEDAGEALRVKLHQDLGAVGVYEPALDLPYVSSFGMEVSEVFQAAHADEDDPAPAVRFSVSHVGTSAYRWNSAEPVEYEGAISNTTNNNPTITLRRGWRYEIVNTNAAGHPMDLVDLGGQRAQDTVMLSQAANTNPAAESNAAVKWVEDGNAMRFTLAGPLTPALLPLGDTNLTGYRCSIASHAGMRGQIVQLD